MPGVSPVDVADHGHGLLFTPPPTSHSHRSLTSLLEAGDSENDGAAAAMRKKKGGTPLPPSAHSLFGAEPAEAAAEGARVDSSAPYLTASVLLAQLRKAKRGAEQVAAERNAALAELEQSRAKCRALHVQLRNRVRLQCAQTPLALSEALQSSHPVGDEGDGGGGDDEGHE